MSNDNEILVKVDGVSKKFCRDLKKSLWYGMCDVASELLPIQNSKSKIQNSGDALRPGEFWANKDISFELRRGECIGLIGRNGAGKTTLLKMLNGLIKPDEGTSEMRGRVGALIALGAGFNPILTGRENIYVNGSILGLTKEEITGKIEEIIDFSEVREFIDSPVQSYSSGMQVRLGFAVATALNPDVLILDEVLAVGDAAFRAKCYKRISQLRKSAAVIFVSHNMEQVGRICDHALMLVKGHVGYIGEIGEGVSAYDEANDEGNNSDESFLSIEPPVTAFEIKNFPDEHQSGASLKFTIIIESKTAIRKYLFRIVFYANSGNIVAESNSSSEDNARVLEIGENALLVELSQLPLKNGKYRVGFGLIDTQGELLVWSHKQHVITIRGAHRSSLSDCQVKSKFSSLDKQLPSE